MDPLVATAGLIAVGAITPGPNNLIVLRETAERGWKGALPAVAGIVVGGLGLLAAVAAGASVALDREPRLAAAMSGCCCLLLAGLGLGAIVRSLGREGRSSAPKGGALAMSFGGLVLFQFLNPKAWLLVIAAVASIGGPSGPAAIPPSSSSMALAQLAALFVLIPVLGLTLWSWAGLLAMRQLERRPIRIWLDRLTGGMLIGFAVLLLNGTLEVL